MFLGSGQDVAPLWRVGWGTGQRKRVGSGPEPESGGLGCLQERVEAGWGSWWGPGGQAQVAQNLADHRGLFNGGDDRQGAATVRTVSHVDREQTGMSLLGRSIHTMSATISQHSNL